MGYVIISSPCQSYADLDKENPGSGLRLWVSKYGISEPYEPDRVAYEGSSKLYGDLPDELPMTRYLDKIGYPT